MKKTVAKSGLILIFKIICLVAAINFPAPLLAASTFRFIVWSDTKSGLSEFSALSSQGKAMKPLMTFYPGDLCNRGATRSCLDEWKKSLNGGSNNGLAHITFASRGNHDAANTAIWKSYFNFSEVAESIGAVNFSSYSQNLTYSFDYDNSHFVMIDMPNGKGASSMDSETIAWLDTDLTDAENRGLALAFIAFHAPIYYVDGHQDEVSGRLITVLNSHPIVSATFHGHEHVLAYVHIDKNHIPTVTHPFEEFVSGGAGAHLYACKAKRSDWCRSTFGFFLVTVSGNSFTVEAYARGGRTALKTWHFK
jgi:3',5'-cyclic AMP phosphodiesterase CpdA